MEHAAQRSGFDFIAAPLVFAAVVILSLLVWQSELAIPTDLMTFVFIAIVVFGLLSNFLIWAHFTIAENSPLLSPILVLFYLSPIVAYVFASSWTPLVTNNENNRLFAILVSSLFAYFSTYSILFLGIEAFFKGFNININESPLRFIFPGFGIEIDDETKGRSWLIIPAAISLIFSLALAYYLVDVEFPYSLFAPITGFETDNQPKDVLYFIFDETCRAVPIGDICEIWSIRGSPLEVNPDNALFRIVRTLTNVTLGISITLLIVYIQGASSKERK